MKRLETAAAALVLGVVALALSSIDWAAAIRVEGAVRHLLTVIDSLCYYSQQAGNRTTQQRAEEVAK
ncbi:MAG: hypothetical protein AMS25_08275 [Gemmatimonas sp. SM23_52]|nr:MAG: hypothetical protein AMS25_08275 [Gemmatimonas sp. SM23_52]